MVVLIGSSLMALLAIYWLAVWIRILRQNTQTAVHSVQGKLDTARESRREARIPLKSSYPLSAGMVKEVARMRGWHYIGGGGSEGVSKLRFTFEEARSQEAADD